MVEMATLEATSLNEWDLEQMATELFDSLVMMVKDDALTLIQVDANFNGFEAWRRMLARYASTNSATALVAVMRVMGPQWPKDLKEVGSAIETVGVSVERFGKKC